MSSEIADVSEIVTAQRVGVQLPQARCSGFYQKTGDLAREAVNCNALFGRAVDYLFALVVYNRRVLQRRYGRNRALYRSARNANSRI